MIMYTLGLSGVDGPGRTVADYSGCDGMHWLGGKKQAAQVLFSGHLILTDRSGVSCALVTVHKWTSDMFPFYSPNPPTEPGLSLCHAYRAIHLHVT